MKTFSKYTYQTAIKGVLLCSALLLSALVGGIVIQPGSVAAAAAGSIVITEFMADPTAVADTNGEWIELENTSSEAINVTDWDISGSTISGAIILAPGARAVICKNNNQSENGGVVCDAKSGFSLSQTGDGTRSITLRDEKNIVVDTVGYIGSHIIAGKSNYVRNSAFSAETTYQYNTTDYGTPDHNQSINNNLAYITVHNTTDLNKNGRMDYNGEPGIQNAGWKIRLYNSQWQAVPYGENGSNEVTTNTTSIWHAMFRVPAGSYILCQVSKAGRPQSFVASVTSWVTWDNNAVPNNSGNTDEDDVCIAVNGMTVNKRSTHKFGNSIDAEPALGQILITAVHDADGDSEPDWNEEEKHQAGWEVRLYNENWQYIKAAVTNNQPYFPAWFTATPGTYYLCEVIKAGYTQSFARTITSWTSWPEAGVLNQSGKNDEGSQCIAVTVNAAVVTSLLFGNAPLIVEQEKVGSPASQSLATETPALSEEPQEVAGAEISSVAPEVSTRPPQE